MLRGLKGLYHLLIAFAANVWFGFPGRKLTVVGVTGTDGKTTTTTLIYEILKAAGFKTSMITSVHAVIAGKEYDTGFHVTTPSAWWVQKFFRQALDHGDTHFVLEVTSHGLSQQRVFGIKFAVGVLTNVTHEHLDWHGTFENYLKTKISLLKKSKIAVVNRDDAEVYNKAAPLLLNKKLVTYGIRRDALITPGTFPFKTALPGIFNQYNCLSAIAATDALGVDQKIIKNVVNQFKGVAGRMEVLQEKPFRVMVDFAHTPNAIEQALKTVAKDTKGKLIHVFGSAGLRDKTKRSLMGRASSKYADMIVLTEEDYRTEDINDIINQIAQGIPKNRAVFRYPSRADAISFALHHAKSGDTVMITGKGHEKSLCREKIEYPWSDQEAVKNILKTL